MNFFRSGIFSDVESRASSEVSGETGQEASDEGENEAAASESGAGGWSFSGLVKSLGKVSGEVLQAYKEDLSDFADGLKKESEIVAEVTVHAVKGLPHTLESSAVVAQESFESVGQSLEEFGGSLWRGTNDLIATVKEAVQKVDDETAAGSKAKGSASRELGASHPSWKYSRYEAQVNAMQRDSSTYCDEPEDEEDYTLWRSSFVLGEKKADIEALGKDNAFMQELEARIVPLIVEYDSFWTRYFYRLHKLQQAEDARADLVKRATSSTEEELSWDIEEETEEARQDPDGNNTVQPREVVDEAVSDDTQKEIVQHPIRVEEESAEVSSPSAARKSEQREIMAENLGEGGHDEESVSEGSTGSDWLVVQDDNQGVVDTPERPAVTLIKGDENLPAALARRQALEAEEPELEEIGDLPLEDSRKEKKETAASSAAGGSKLMTEEPEDWGDWE